MSLHPTAVADLTLAEPTAIEPGGPFDSPVHRAVLAALSGGGAYFLGGLLVRVAELVEAAGERPDPPTHGEVVAALWDLVWSGHVTNDRFAPLRARLGAGSAAHRTRQPQARARTLGRSPRLGLRGGLPRSAGGSALAGPGADTGGRWSLLPAREPDPTLRAHALAAQLLDRHGVLTRAVAPAEGVTQRFGAVYRVLAALEQAGQVRRGYFVEHLGGSQFALPGAVDRLRVDARTVERAAERSAERAAEHDADAGPHDRDRGPGAGTRHPDGDAPFVVVLAATDPANPYGAALAWPPPPADPQDAPTTAGRHRPGRKAGAVVVLVDGALVLYVERGGRTVLTFTRDREQLRLAAVRLAEAVRGGRLGRLTLGRIDGAEVLTGTTLESPAGRALVDAGFAPTPRGLRLRGQA